MDSLLQFKRNINSQNGEDGIIEELFKIMNIQKGNFIEFGAWDGKAYSNTYKLFEEGWSGIYIEADQYKYSDLVNNFKSYKNITCLREYVGFSNDSSLDAIIDRSNHVNKSFVFVSIDVDGLDYFIFDKFNKYLPKVICIEVNSGLCPLLSEVLPANIAENNVGQSITVMSMKAAEKDYFPLCYSGNLFLVKNEYKHLFKNYIKSVEGIYIDFLNYIVKPDLNLSKHLFELYCLPDINTRYQRQIKQFRYIFPDNEYMITFLTKLLQ